MKTVCVLMSTYNGEKYLSEQLDSLLFQEGVNVVIDIRDDGSTDNTMMILKQYKNKYPNINITFGKNIGYAKSFYLLLKNAGNFEYYAFSDQDDVWDKDKLIIAINCLEKKLLLKPLLYGCNLRLVDENLRNICDMCPPQDSDFQKGTYILDKYSYGCTMVFNKELRNLVLIHEPNQVISHDNWVGLVAVFLGDFIFDSDCHISYRQHGKNVVGGIDTFQSRWKRRLKALKNINKLSRSLVANELLVGYGDVLSEKDRKLLFIIANYKNSIRYKIEFLKSKDLHRASREKDLLFRIQILLSLA